jgi:hypothetical protein
MMVAKYNNNDTNTNKHAYIYEYTQVLGDVARQYMVLAKYRKANLIANVLLMCC